MMPMRSDTAETEEEELARLRGEEVARREAKSSTADKCPTCGASDDNPTFETLAHCWRCGHRSDQWPDADLEARRAAAHRRRLGLE